MIPKDQSKQMGKTLLNGKKSNIRFKVVESLTSEEYERKRKADMHKLQKSVTGYSDAYFSLAKHHL